MGVATGTPRLQDLPDVSLPGDGQALVWDETTSTWIGADLDEGSASQGDLDALEATVAALDTEVDTKQDAATAATDAELTAHSADATFQHGFTDTIELQTRVPTTNQKAALVGTAGSPSASVPYATKTTTDALSTSIALKQDASTAATDSELTAGLALKQDSSEKGAANGYASLGAGGTVPTAQIPALALVNVNPVATEVAQLALTAQAGDVAVRSDLDQAFMHNGGTAGTMADWTAISSPGSVTSVNGQTGIVVLDAGDVGAATSADVDTAVATHVSDTTSVHGIADTTVLATDAEVAAAVAAHESDTTVHGVDTANVPSSGQKAALAGTSGTPSGTNLYATKDTTDALTTSVAAKQDASTAATDAELASHASDATAVHGIADTADLILEGDARLSDARTPSGSAGGVLSGTYPDPVFAVDMATQAELNAVAAGEADFASVEKWSVV